MGTKRCRTNRIRGHDSVNHPRRIGTTLRFRRHGQVKLFFPEGFSSTGCARFILTPGPAGPSIGSCS